MSAYNFGAVLRYGWYGTDKVDQAFKSLDMAAKARTDEANGAKLAYFPLTPDKPKNAPNPDLAEAYEYYHTARGQRSDAPSICAIRNLAELVTYDFMMSRSSSRSRYKLWQAANRRAVDERGCLKAARPTRDKNLHIVEGGTHVGLYDKPDIVGEAMSNLAPSSR